MGALMTCLGVPLLFLPKINLLGVSGETAGVRIDDFLLAITLGLLACSYMALRRAIFSYAEAALLLFLFLALLSNIIYGGNPLYPLRLVEYFAFFYIGIHAARWVSLKKVLLAFLYLNAGLIILQYMGFVGAFALGTYSMGTPIGIGSGNWEIGLLLNIVFISLAFGKLCKPSVACIYGLVILGLHLVVGSRTPAATLLIFYGIFILGFFKKNPLVIVIIGFLIGIITTVIYDSLMDMVSESYLFSRMGDISLASLTTVIEKMWATIPPASSFSKYKYAEEIFNAIEGSDLSLIFRLEKVIGAIKYFYDSGPMTWLIGTGPGRYGTAMDSGNVRLFVENGALGFIAFFLILIFSLRKFSARWHLISVFIVSMFTLDTYLAYKIMSMLFFIAGISTGYNVLYVIREKEHPVPAA